MQQTEDVTDGFIQIKNDRCLNELMIFQCPNLAFKFSSRGVCVAVIAQLIIRCS